MWGNGNGGGSGRGRGRHSGNGKITTRVYSVYVSMLMDLYSVYAR